MINLLTFQYIINDISQFGMKNGRIRILETKSFRIRADPKHWFRHITIDKDSLRTVSLFSAARLVEALFLVSRVVILTSVIR